MVDAFECKWDLRRVETRGLSAFRALYPKGANYIVAHAVAEPYTRTIDGISVTILSPSNIAGG